MVLTSEHLFVLILHWSLELVRIIAKILGLIASETPCVVAHVTQVACHSICMGSLIIVLVLCSLLGIFDVRIYICNLPQTLIISSACPVCVIHVSKERTLSKVLSHSIPGCLFVQLRLTLELLVSLLLVMDHFLATETLILTFKSQSIRRMAHLIVQAWDLLQRLLCLENMVMSHGRAKRLFVVVVYHVVSHGTVHD